MGRMTTAVGRCASGPWLGAGGGGRPATRRALSCLDIGALRCADLPCRRSWEPPW